MNIFSFSMILCGVLLNAAAQLLLKAGVNTLNIAQIDRVNVLPLGFKLATEPHIIGGLMCYVISVVLWIAALVKVDVSVAYPMLSIGYVVNAIAAWYLFGEALSVNKLIGIGIIILGVFIVARS